MNTQHYFTVVFDTTDNRWFIDSSTTPSLDGQSVYDTQAEEWVYSSHTDEIKVADWEAERDLASLIQTLNVLKGA